jgi:hypothetical protein
MLRLLLHLLCGLLVVSLSGLAPLFEDEGCEDEAAQCDCDSCAFTCSCCSVRPVLTSSPGLPPFVGIAARIPGAPTELIVSPVGADIFHPPKSLS